MNFTALIVCFVLSAGRLCTFWTKLPKHMEKAMSAMFESSSPDWPIPIGWPIAFSLGAALRTWSHVYGASPIPFQRSCRQTTGSGT